MSTQLMATQGNPYPLRGVSSSGQGALPSQPPIPDWPNDVMRSWDARGFVVFDSAAWDALVTPANGVIWCRKNHLLGHEQGIIRSFPLPCDLWSCPDCAPAKAYRRLHHLATLLAPSSTAYVSTTTDANWGSFRKALGRAHTADDSWWMAVRRGGRRFVVSSCQPDSDTGSVRSVEPVEAFEWARTKALALPGLLLPRPISWRRGSQPVDPPPTITSWGRLSADERDSARVEINEQLSQRFGRGPYAPDDVDRLGRQIVNEIIDRRGIDI